MKDLRQALSEIHTIRNQVARGTEFRGYGPASIAVSGILAFLVAALQTEWMARTPKPDPAVWLGAWAATAAVSVAQKSRASNSCRKRYPPDRDLRSPSRAACLVASRLMPSRAASPRWLLAPSRYRHFVSIQVLSAVLGRIPSFRRS